MAVKVCHFTSTHPPKDQRIFYKECVSLAKAGYEVYLVEQGETEDDSGVHIIGTGERRPGRYYRLLVRPRNVYRLAKEIDADIYHFHDMELIPYGLKLKKAGKKVIFDSHEDFAHVFSESTALFGPAWLKRLAAKCYGGYENHAVRRFDAVVSVTPHVCDRLRLQNASTYMITNYPLLDGAAWGQEFAYHEDSDYIAFAGQINDFSFRLVFLTEAVQGLPNIKLKLCGPVHGANELEKIQEADQSHKTEYLGVLPYMQVPDFLNHARISLVLYSSNGNIADNIGSLGSNKLFESMLCGVPVICSNFLLWQEIVNQYHCGICVNAYDKAEVRRAIEYLLSHPEEAAEMGRNGRKAALETYNWNTQEAVLLKMYRSL